MTTRIAVLSGDPGATARLASGLQDRFAEEAAVVRVAAAARPPVRFMLARPRRVGDRIIIRRSDAIDGEGMNSLLDAWRLRVLVADQAADAGLVDEIRTIFSRFSTVHIHLAPGPAPPARARSASPPPARSQARAQALLAERADAVIAVQRCSAGDILARAAARLQPARLSTASYVDVIVGGQYGSEGKGQVAAYLAKEYDLLVRVGGPNAGHRVPGIRDPYHHLPSGTNRSGAKLAIGPGSAINVEKLHEEISRNRVEHGRLTIDPHAVIIEQDDIREEQKMIEESIGSTAQGVGWAASRKMRRGDDVRLAKDVAELGPYCRPMLAVLEDAVTHGRRIMLEGTQGTGLSIHHGHYPHVTARDTTASGCLADAGIHPRLVRRVVMVARTYPIRVGGKSGPMSQEINFDTISGRSGKDLGKIKETEIGSTTGRPRRVGEFDWDLIRRAALLNGATDVALTFADYISEKNGGAHRLEQLTPETVSMVEEVERVTEARASLIATGFSPRSIIDRREW